MMTRVSRALARLQQSFAAFTAGQKVVAIIGSGALLLAGFMVFKWAATPNYAPLYSGLAPADASAVISELDSSGVKYKLTNGGSTILVPNDAVYATRINLSGQGLPSASDSGYSILDKQGISTSQFQEQTSYKRAMEGELANTIEALDSVDTAIVHLALPQKQVFTDTQDPSTASVLVRTRAGSTMTPEQVQAVVNLVSSSVEGLSADKVTVTDATGKVLSAPTDSASGAVATQNQQVIDYQNRMTTQVQAMLDRVLGPGNSAVTVTPVLSFDKAVSEKTTYLSNDKVALSDSKNIEKYKGAPGYTAGAGGVVGPDGQTEVPTGATGANAKGSKYTKKSETRDNAVGKLVEQREAAPGNVSSLHISAVLDPRALKGNNAQTIQNLIASGVGIDTTRGDTIAVSTMAFDRTAEAAAAAELAAGDSAAKKAATMTMYKTGGIAGVLVIVALIAWFQGRRRAKARAEATQYVMEQLRRDAAERQTLALEPSPAMLALESEPDPIDDLQAEIAALVDRQPDDVANLLRGWLVERGA